MPDPLWITTTPGVPQVADFASTNAAGTPLIINTATSALYYLAPGNVVAAVPAGSGGGTGTVTSVSVTAANGVSGTVATATVTPAITLTLGAITPSSVAASGAITGSNLSGTNTGDSVPLLFSAMGGSVISAATNIVQTSGRTVAGQYPALYVRSATANQNLYTAAGDALIAAVTAEGAGVIAAAQAAILAILNRIRFVDSLGSYWEIEDSTQEIHAGHFGAVADATYTEATGAIGGTDSQPAIQALIDWRVYLKSGTTSANRDCVVPAGMFRCNNQVQLSYGDTFRRVVLRGAGNSFPVGLGGTTLAFTDPAQPGVVIQGGRYSHVRDMALLSGGRAWILNNNISLSPDAGAKAAGYDDRHMSAYWDPAQPLRSPRRRYAPHAAIAVDPYIGAAPAPVINAWAASTAYVFGQQVTLASKLYICCTAGTSASSGGPTGTADWIKDGPAATAAWWHYVGPSSLAQAYPTPPVAAFLPLATRIGYGKGNYSSDAPNRDVAVIGFAVGTVVQPSGADGNGDFMGFQNFSTQYTPVSISICQTQARANSLNRVQCSTGHTFMTGIMHGKQSGRIGGAWTDVALGSMQQIFECIPGGSSGGLVANNIYCEGIQRIGTVIGGGAIADSFVFVGGAISFYHEDGNGKRGVPATILGNPASSAIGLQTGGIVIFQGVYINGYKGALTLDCNFEMRNALLSSAESVLAIANQAQARYLNTTASGLVPMRLAFKNDQLIRYYGANETTLGAIGGATNPRNSATSRDNPASMFTPSLAPVVGIETITNIQTPQAYQMGAGQSFSTASSLSGRTLTLITSQANYNLIFFQIVPGAVIAMTNGQRYYITGRTGAGPYTFTATLLNGYSYDNAGVISYEGGVPDFTSASTIIGYFLAGGVFTPSYPLFANIGSASTNLTSVERGDGYSGHITTTSPVAAGDSFCVDQYADQPLSAQQIVSSVTPGAYPAATITMNFPSNLDAIKWRLPLFVRGS